MQMRCKSSGITDLQCYSGGGIMVDCLAMEPHKPGGHAGSGYQYCRCLGVIISDHHGEVGMITMRLLHGGEYGRACGLPVGMMIIGGCAANLLPIGHDDARIDTVDTCSGHQAKNGGIRCGFVRYHGSLLKIALPVYRARMAKDNSSTESIPPPSRWLDALDDAAALEVMATDQLAAAAAVRSAAESIAVAAAAILDRLQASPESRLFYAGAGTSARIGVQDGVELTPTFGWPADRTGFLIAGGVSALTRSIEGAEDDPAAAENDLAAAGVNQCDVVIGIAASGTTPYTCAAVRAARQAGSLTIGISSNAATPLLAAADHGIALLTGAESVAGSTRMKAGTAQKICLNMISTLVMVRMGKVRNGLMVDMQPTNAKLRQRQQQIDALLKDQ